MSGNEGKVTKSYENVQGGNLTFLQIDKDIRAHHTSMVLEILTNWQVGPTRRAERVRRDIGADAERLPMG